MTPLLSAEAIAKQVSRLAVEIVRDLPEDFICVALMDGAFVFAADLMRALHGQGRNPAFESLGLSSYGDGQSSSGNVIITKDLARSVEGQAVLIIDDVLETGYTLAAAVKLLDAAGASLVKTCVLARKPVETRVIDRVDFVGWDAPDEFLVGYGLDDAGRYRGYPYIFSL